MKYHCNICDNKFKKFILFEGHFDFNAKCREEHGCLLQCYICSQEFQHSAALKYHFEKHAKNSAKKITPVPQIPKITLKKEWNFKIIPQVEKVKESENIQIGNKKLIISRRPSENWKAQYVVSDAVSVPNVEPKSKEPSDVEPKSEEPSDVEPKSNEPSNEPTSSESPSPSQKRYRGYKCEVCKLLFKGGEPLENFKQRHEKAHANGQFKCEICDVKFSKLSFAWHQKIVHGIGNDRYRCKTCNEHFMRSNQLAKHEQLHKISNASNDVNEIQLTPNVGIKKVGAIIRCKICKSSFNRKNMSRHMEVHKHGKFRCDQCEFRGRPIRFTLNSLIIHRKRQHPEMDADVPRKCGICKATLSSNTALKRHMQVHVTGDQTCSICDIRFTLQSLVRHQKRFHPDLEEIIKVLPEKQTCEICKATCDSKNALELHADMHENGQFECETCQIKFTFEELESHNKRDHSNQCPICNIKVSQSSHLKRHMSLHVIGNKKCEICQIRFGTTSLINHYKVFHPELDFRVSDPVKNRWMEKKRREQKRLLRLEQHLQFQCQMCKATCGDAKKLEHHMDVHTNADDECKICKAPFRKLSLPYHLKRFHPEVERKERILKALRRHMADELNSLNESDAKEIPIILEDSYQLMAQKHLRNQCIICKLPCSESRKLDIHIRVHIDGEYKCELCNVWFTKNSLECHQRRCHPEFYEERVLNGIRLTKEENGKENELSEKQPKNYNTVCDVCNINCGGYDKLAEHTKVHFTGDVKCDVCNIRFTAPSLRYHMKRFHPDVVVGVAQVKLKCDICKLKCSDAKRLETHMTVHTEGDVKCEICDIPFTRPSLINHMRRMHPSLHITQSKGIIQKALMRHVSAQGLTIDQRLEELEENQFKCLICKLTFAKSNRKKFDSHIKVHAEGDVKCQICDIWFTKPSLEYHYRRFHPGLEIVDTKDQYQCELCKLVTGSPGRLKEHMKVHRGNIQCTICKIGFTKPSLIYHYSRFHPNVPKEDRILKAIENCASKKNLHTCHICKKSFTRICYLKLHKKTHRNVGETIEIPLDFNIPLYNHSDSSSNSDSLSNCKTEIKQEKREITLKRRNYECYVCKDPFTIASELQDHVSRHIVYQQWIDPLDVYLSNWDADEAREIISNQPLVLVENLDMKNVNLKSLSNFGQSKENSIEVLPVKDEHLLEMDIKITMNMETDCSTAPDTTQMDCEEICEIISDDEDDEDDETIQQQLMNYTFIPYTAKVDSTIEDDNENYVLISDDSDVDDITESFHCYFCNRKLRSLRELGVHENSCKMKVETR